MSVIGRELGRLLQMVEISTIEIIIIVLYCHCIILKKLMLINNVA